MLQPRLRAVCIALSATLLVACESSSSQDTLDASSTPDATDLGAIDRSAPDTAIHDVSADGFFRDADDVATPDRPDATVPDVRFSDDVASDASISAVERDRVLTFRNECPGLTLQIGATGGYVRDCGSDGACPEGTQCLRERMPPGCFWVLPSPAAGSENLRTGESATYVLRNPSINHIAWSGNVYGRTGCESGTCETGACPGGPCRPGVGPVGPTSLAEFTLVDNGPDFYDVSLINGINVPIAMSANAGAAYRAAPSAPGDAYWCGGAGAASASHPRLTECTWRFDTSITGTDRRTVLRLVASGGPACARDADCTAPTVCGTSLITGTTRVSQSCGRQIGWWTAHELCAATANTYGTPLDCASAASAGTRANLFGCDGPVNQSCYSVGAASTCCGCVDWPYATTEACRAHNPTWSAVVEPWVRFVKSACPTAYSYQYDDMTSTFTCQSEGTSNGADYTITFCPQGRRGF